MYEIYAMPWYAEWLFAGILIAIVLAGSIAHWRWGARGLLGVYGAFFAFCILRVLSRSGMLWFPALVGTFVLPPVMAFLSLIGSLVFQEIRYRYAGNRNGRPR